MSEDEQGKSIVPLSVKALAKYERSSPIANAFYPPGPVITPEPYVKNAKFVDCKDSHIGPKIVASHVTVQLPKENLLGSRLSRKGMWLLGGFLTTATLIAVTVTLIFTVPPTYPDIDDDIPDGGDHPSDWYYIREDRNASGCEEPSVRILRDHVVVDTLDRTCTEPTSCLELIQGLPEDTDFYLSGGRVYEGWGWNCKPRKKLKVVFLSNGKATQLDMYSFNNLINMGVNMKEIDPVYLVLPACCVEDSIGPSRGILLFLETLPNFTHRECLVKNQNCQTKK